MTHPLTVVGSEGVFSLMYMAVLLPLCHFVTIGAGGKPIEDSVESLRTIYNNPQGLLAAMIPFGLASGSYNAVACTMALNYSAISRSLCGSLRPGGVWLITL